MHQSEADQLINCLQCGAEVSPEGDRIFVLSEGRALCYACALDRRGVYDEAHDTWTHAPELTGLALEDRPAL